MRIAGLQKCSMVDYPGKICAVIFLAGCNMNCSYCHNKSLIAGSVQGCSRMKQANAGNDVTDTSLSIEEVMAFLQKRKGLLDAVCITGGEATLHPDLPELAARIKQMGFLVKLDTNGTNPDVVSKLIEKGLLDYVAMDVKAPEHKYTAVCGRSVAMNNIRRSITLLKGCSIDYEFRTTFVPNLKKDDIREIAKAIQGAKAYYLQQFRLDFDERAKAGNASKDNASAEAKGKTMAIPMEVLAKTDSKEYNSYYSNVSAMPHDSQYIMNTWEAVRNEFPICGVRGL